MGSFSCYNEHMSQDRFSFLELPAEGVQQAPAYISLQDIPSSQYLNYLDLLALKPTAAMLKQVSRKLIEKYQFVPIQTIPANLPMRLPKNLDEQYHIRWKCEGPHITYIAMVPTSKSLTYQLLYNAIGQGLYILPITAESFQRFMNEKYEAIKQS